MPFWGRRLVFAEFYTENNDGIQEIGNNSLIFFQVHFNRKELYFISRDLKGVESVFAKKKLSLKRAFIKSYWVLFLHLGMKSYNS